MGACHTVPSTNQTPPCLSQSPENCADDSCYRPDFYCNIKGPAGKSPGKSLCNELIGKGSGELSLAKRGKNCHFVSDGAFIWELYGTSRTYESACCGGAEIDDTTCTTIGEHAYCRRDVFKGDPLTCCLKNARCSVMQKTWVPTDSFQTNCFRAADGNNKEDPLYSTEWNQDLLQRVFSDDALTLSCSDGQNGQPDHMTMGGPDCNEYLTEYCGGGTGIFSLLSDEELFSRWTNDYKNYKGSSCIDVIKNELYYNTDGFGPCPTIPINSSGICNKLKVKDINAQGLQSAKNIVNRLLNTFVKKGYVLGSLPGQPTYSTFQNFIFDEICCPYGIVCVDFLQTYCKQFTTRDLKDNPLLARFCGCYLNENQYAYYADNYNVQAHCSPTCNRTNVIPLFGSSANPIVCTTSTCIIDDITLNINSSNIKGDIDFSQYCSNSGGNTTCIMDNNTIDINNSTINGNVIPFNENCGGGVSCFTDNPSGKGPQKITTECSTTNIETQNPMNYYNQKVDQLKSTAIKKSTSYNLIILVFFITLLYFILYLLQPPTTPKKTKNPNGKLPGDITKATPSNYLGQPPSDF